MKQAPTKKKKPCETETRFFTRIERLKAAGLNPRVETKPASRYFGEVIHVSIFGNMSTAAWMLRKAGELHPRTSQKTFGMINGERVPLAQAYRRITNNY